MRRPPRVRTQRHGPDSTRASSMDVTVTSDIKDGKGGAASAWNSGCRDQTRSGILALHYFTHIQFAARSQSINPWREVAKTRRRGRQIPSNPVLLGWRVVSLRWRECIHSSGGSQTSRERKKSLNSSSSSPRKFQQLSESALGSSANRRGTAGRPALVGFRVRLEEDREPCR